MVKVREEQPLGADGSVNLELWLERLQKQIRLDKPDTLLKACKLSRSAQEKMPAREDLWAENTPGSFLTGLEMAEILAELRLDEDALVAAVLYRAVREKKLGIRRVRDDYGDKIARLIEGVLQMAAIGSVIHPTPDSVLGQSQGQLDNVRKMLVTLIEDVRVALIKLAERTCAIRAAKYGDRRRRYRIAREVFDVYAPLAHRLGIGHIKWELEDLSFRYLQPSAYKQIARLLDEKRLDRQKFIDDVLARLRQELDRAGIRGELMGRAKHIYSIWRKMQRKGIGFDQVYDVRAVRVLVPEVRDCYAVLGIVHSLWHNIPHEFDDYINSPKKNGYRSLHTAVFGPRGKVLEVQIRTFEMHEDAELGVCAHWVYKGTDTRRRGNSYENKIAWLRQVLEWQDDLGNASELVDQLKSDIEHDRIYAFTPDGHVVELARGATPLDFAYRVHTEVGHRCRGAKVNGRIVPLTRKLATGDQVEILTARSGGPSRDWMNPNMGYVVSSRARAKIRHWFKEEARDKNLSAGRHIADRELKRLAINSLEHQVLAGELGYGNTEELYVALGSGDIKVGQLIGAAQRLMDQGRDEEQLSLDLPAGRREESKTPKGIRIAGVGNLLTVIANCCKPVPGDPIVGYVTQGRGVSIHRQDCLNALQLQEQERERILEVSWDTGPDARYSVDIRIDAYDRHGLLRDVMVVTANEKVNVTSVNTHTRTSDGTASLLITLEVPRLEVLGRLMDRIGQLPNIIDVHRQLPGRRDTDG